MRGGSGGVLTFAPLGLQPKPYLKMNLVPVAPLFTLERERISCTLTSKPINQQKLKGPQAHNCINGINET